MILPHTSTAAILLLVAAFICLGSWATLFKATGKEWRFELFYYDFAVGAIALAVLAAYTLGTLGSDLSFSDRMMVAGRTAQGMLAAAGFVFNVGNMLLLASVSLVGMAAAFPLTVGVALIVASFWNFHATNFFTLIAGIILLLAAAVVDGTASKLRDLAVLHARAAAHPNPKVKKRPLKTRRATKGIVTAVLGGILIGVTPPVASRGLGGDLGLGPYAAILMFAIGIVVSTVVFNFYFLNISIEGAPVGFGGYFRGRPGQHFLGFASGGLLILGLLAAMLAASVPKTAGIEPALKTAIPGAAAILAVLWGAGVWKEFSSGSKNAKAAIVVATVLYAFGLALFSVSVTVS